MQKISKVLSPSYLLKTTQKKFYNNSQFPNTNVTVKARELFSEYIKNKNLDHNNVGYVTQTKSILEEVFYKSKHKDKIGFMLLNHALGNTDYEYFKYVIHEHSNIIKKRDNILTDVLNLDLTKPRSIVQRSKFLLWEDHPNSDPRCFALDLNFFKTFIDKTPNKYNIHCTIGEEYPYSRFIISTTLHPQKYIIFDTYKKTIIGSIPHKIEISKNNVYESEQPCASFSFEKIFYFDQVPHSDTLVAVLYALIKPDYVATYGIDRTKIITAILQREHNYFFQNCLI